MSDLATRLSGEFRPLRDVILARNMHFGPVETPTGIIVPDDDVTERGIHARWTEVVSVGPEQDAVMPGEWILVAHGRWSPGFDLNGETVRLIDPEGVLLAADEGPSNLYAVPDMSHRR